MRNKLQNELTAKVSLDLIRGQPAKTVWHQNHLFTTRDWVIDFLATEGYKVQNKSLLHTRLLLQYYNQ